MAIRVATSTIYALSNRGMQTQQSAQARLQNQLTTGRRILTPSDDPIGASRALSVSQAQSINSQYSVNSKAVDSALGLTESTLQQVVELVQNVQRLAVQAGNPALSNSDRQSVNVELKSRYEELMGLANTTDGTGQYLFSGFAGSTKPFSESSFGNVQYLGDEGQRLVQISASRNLPISDSGSAVFGSVKNGNGTFQTGAAAGNTGSGIVDIGTVANPLQWSAAGNVQDYKVSFSVDAAGATTYDIVDATSNKSMIDGYDYAGGARAGAMPRAYNAGSEIEFKRLPTDPAGAAWDAGVSISIKGVPASGDSFTVKPSQSQDMFSMLADFSGILGAPQFDENSKATYQTGLGRVIGNLSSALDSVLTTQASIGARMKETESVRNTNEDLDLQYSKTLSGLQDLDYTKALSDFAMTQTLLDAARATFSKVQGMSLFKYL
ncbi:flagellar hook-associated protein FlgL [Jeongeupia naejangsanensis]|uniref:Flagellar hook-associated protein FlgL n=1 Tax=Jeongeupia naejangsanensis TaxID=613195 RepID=A0ABS2BI44_9NEIS|nr:flagellar hook-associated protein FlgL [Jeongeupia naejangsanensis]MBM3115271.1 flagellar hook-associated protein FlgL [Jeongeupia naejangsanensis]